MTDNQKPIVIRAKDGTKINLACEKHTFDTKSQNATDRLVVALIDALVAALSVPEETPLQIKSEWDAGYEQGWCKRGKATRQAAGVVEGEG